MFTMDDVTTAGNFTSRNRTAPLHAKGPNMPYLTTIWVIDTYVMPVEAAFGCLGNLLSLLVLGRARFRRYGRDGRDSRAYVGLFLLACSDLVFCVGVIPRSFLGIPSGKQHFRSLGFATYYQAYSSGLLSTACICSTWIMVTVAVMRWLGICHPFWSRHKLYAVRINIVYAVVIILAIGLNIPTFFQTKLIAYNSQVFNGTFYLIIPGPMDILETKHGLVYYYVRCVFAVLIPAIALIGCHVALVKALRTSRILHRESNVRERDGVRRNRVTLTLLVIAMSFILLIVPVQIMEFFTYTIENQAHKLPVFSLWRCITRIMEVTAFSFNFLLYVSMNEQFRRELCTDRFCTIHRRRDVTVDRRDAFTQPLTQL